MIAPSSNWNPTRFLRFEESFSTSRKVSLVVTDAGKAFIKTMMPSQSHHPLACELLGTQLADWFGLPTLDYAILTLQDDDEIPLGHDGGELALPGPAFATRQVLGQPWGGSSSELDKTENTDIITKLVVFDTWTLNWDRCPPEKDGRKNNYDNVFLTSEHTSGGNWRMLAIDHTECFSNSRDLTPRLNRIDRIKDLRVYGAFDKFRIYLHLDLLEEAAKQIGTISRDVIGELIETIPAEWDVTAPIRDALADLIYSRATFLAENVVDMLYPRYFEELF